MDNEETYAPKPGEIKKVIVVSHGGKKVATYETLFEALTAVYQLPPAAARGVRALVEGVKQP